MLIYFHLKYVVSLQPSFFYTIIRYFESKNAVECTKHKILDIESSEVKFYMLFSLIDALKTVEISEDFNLEITHESFCTAVLESFNCDSVNSVIFRKVFRLDAKLNLLQLKNGTICYFKDFARKDKLEPEAYRIQEIHAFINAFYNFYVSNWTTLFEDSQEYFCFHLQIYFSLFIKTNSECLNILKEIKKKKFTSLNKQPDVSKTLITSHELLEGNKKIENDILNQKTYGIRVWDMTYFSIELLNEHFYIKKPRFSRFIIELDACFNHLLVFLHGTKRSNCPLFICSNLLDKNNHIYLQPFNKTFIASSSLVDIFAEIDKVIQVIRKFRKSEKKDATLTHLCIETFKNAKNACIKNIKSILVSNKYEITPENACDVETDLEIDKGELMSEPSANKISKPRKKHLKHNKTRSDVNSEQVKILDTENENILETRNAAKKQIFASVEKSLQQNEQAEEEEKEDIFVNEISQSDKKIGNPITSKESMHLLEIKGDVEISEAPIKNPKVLIMRKKQKRSKVKVITIPTLTTQKQTELVKESNRTKIGSHDALMPEFQESVFIDTETLTDTVICSSGKGVAFSSSNDIESSRPSECKAACQFPNLHNKTENLTESYKDPIRSGKKDIKHEIFYPKKNSQYIHAGLDPSNKKLEKNSMNTCQVVPTVRHNTLSRQKIVSKMSQSYPKPQLFPEPFIPHVDYVRNHEQQLDLNLVLNSHLFQRTLHLEQELQAKENLLLQQNLSIGRVFTSNHNKVVGIPAKKKFLGQRTDIWEHEFYEKTKDNQNSELTHMQSAHNNNSPIDSSRCTYGLRWDIVMQSL